MINWNWVNILRRTLRIGWFKTLYLNFNLFPFYKAYRLPIIVSRYTYIYSLSGKLILNAPVKFGMIRIGFLGEDVVVPKNERALIQLEGDLVCGNNVRLGCGVILRIEPNAKLILHDNVRIGSKCRIIAYDSISIGENTGISWECQLLDSNMHDIVEMESGRKITSSSPIIIGANNWIGTRCSIMKGTRTPDFTTVGSSSFCNKNYQIPPYSIIAGSPAKLVKSGYVRADYI